MAKFGAERWEGRGRGEGYRLDVGGRVIGFAGFSRASCLVVVETMLLLPFPTLTHGHHIAVAHSRKTGSTIWKQAK